MELVQPVPIDPTGTRGPTPNQARGPRWRRTSAGLYVSSAVDRGQVEQRILEESCRLPRGGAVTGWAALRLHGVGYMDGLGADGRTELPVALTIPPGRALRGARGIVVHRERLDPTEVTVRHGVPATVPARAAFDAARRADDLRAAVQVLDLALAAGVIGRERFRAWIEAKSGWPGLRQVRSALALAEERCASPQETALRMIWLLDARLPRPRCNWPVADANGQFIGRPDLLSTDFGVIGEFDGATHRTRSQHREDLRRDDRFRAVGLETFRVVGADLGDIELVVRRIRDAIDRSARLPKSYLIRA